MPLTNATPLQQYFINGVMTGFVDLIMPLTSFAYSVNQNGAALNDHVRVPFAISPTSASSAFAYSTGYTGNNGNIQSKDVQLSNLLYQPLQLTDAEMAILPPAVVEKQGQLLGRRLGIDFVSASLVSINTTNYLLSSSFPAASFTSSIAMADLDFRANTQKWPDGLGNRYLIANTTVWQSLLNNNNVNQAFAFGGISAIQNGQIPALFGFQPFKTTVALQPNINGFIASPNALVVAMAYHKPAPQASSILVNSQMLTDEKTGVVLGYREWYDASHATVNKVFDVLGGATVGDANALILIK